MRRLGNIRVRQRMLRLSRPWLASVVWSACVLGCSLALLQPSLGWAAAELEYAKGIVEYGKGNYLEALAISFVPYAARGRA